MENKLIKILIALGVPGVALGIFYLLLRGFEFKFTQIDANMTAYIIILFLLLVGTVTLYALSKHHKDQISVLTNQESKVLYKKIDDNIVIGGVLANKNIELTKDLFLTSIKVSPNVPRIGEKIQFSFEIKNASDKNITISQVIIGSSSWGNSMSNIVIAPFGRMCINLHINALDRNAERILSGNPHHFRLSIRSQHLPDIDVEDVAIISISR